MPRPSLESPEHAAAATGPIIAELAASLEVDLDALAGRVAEETHAEMPELGDQARVTARTLAAVRANLAGFMEFIRQPATLENVGVDADTIEYARAFVHRGIPLPTAMRTFRLAHAQMWRAWSEAIEARDLAPQTRAAVAQLVSDAMFQFVDRTTTLLVEEYELERERWNRSAEARRAETVAAILDGAPTDIDAASRALKHDLRRTHIGLVLWAVGDEATATDLITLERAATELSQSLTGSSRPLILPSRGRTLWAWTAALEPPPDDTIDAALAAVRRGDFRAAVGEPAAGIDGFRDTHEAAVHTRRVMRLAGDRGAVAQRYRSVSLNSLLTADQRQMHRFVLDELGGLAADDDGTVRLRATLLVYFEERSSPAKTGRRLGIHTNSVHYRIRRCTELIGHPIHERRSELETALRLKQTLALDEPPANA